MKTKKRGASGAGTTKKNHKPKRKWKSPGPSKPKKAGGKR